MRDYGKSGQRSPTSHRTPQQIQKMDAGFNATPLHIKQRSERNQARRIMTHAVGAKAIEGKDVNHIRMVKNGGTNARRNLNVQTAHKNRGWRRDQ
jgi:hypothetical protein